MGKKRNGYRILTGKPEGNRPQGRSMDLIEIGWGDVDCLGIGTSGELL
jgi:hypothetical protein